MRAKVHPRLLAALAVLAASAAGAGGAGAAASPPPSVVASACGPVVSVYRSPGARRPFLRLRSPNAEGSPLVFLVAARRPGWERVRLPVRPNGSQGWIRDSDVILATNPYRVDVSLAAHRIEVRRGS